MASANRTFHLESVAGAPVNEYRIRAGRVEFRSRAPGGVTLAWRALTHQELMLHLNLNTAVARWLWSLWEEVAVKAKGA